MGYQEIEHTGDCAIRVWGENLAMLFADAARGLYNVSGTRLGAGRRIRRKIRLRADDTEGLLVAFLSELIYLQEHSGLGFQEFDLDVQERQLTGTMRGGDLLTIAQPLKAVTYHDLEIQEIESQYVCQLVFDA